MEMSDYSGDRSECGSTNIEFEVGGSSTCDEACQTEGPWDIIIVNQIPTNFDYEKFISLFSQYGNIESIYWCKKTNRKGMKHERVARITFTHEDDARKVLEAAQEKLIKYNDHVLMVTLASNDYSPIQNLPDTCLREIFARVNSPEDKFNVERVCRRWRDHGRCCWSNIKEIEIQNIGAKNAWRTIVSRIANSVQYLYFTRFEDDAEELFEIAAEHCVSLKRLNCHFLEWNYALASRAMHTILQNNPKLSRLELHMLEPFHLNMNFMEVLPAELYEIDLRVINADAILPPVALSRYQNLRALKFHGITVNHREAFNNVVNLEHLALIFGHIPEDSISTILRNNKSLKYLDIATDNLSDASLRSLQQLPNLQVLVIESWRFSDAHLQEMRRLKALSCFKCSRITDGGIGRYLDQASHLTHLGLSGSAQCTVESVKIARRWSERTGKSLELFVDHHLFREYSALGWQDIENFKVTVINEMAHDYSGENWFRELVE